MTMRGQGDNYFQPALGAVQSLLREVQLPSSDLSAAHLGHFIGCGTEALDGVVGLELYPPYALLRSLAVAQGKRGGGIGRALLLQAERYACERGVTELYLLTTTAERFFARAGYERVPREAAPAAIGATREFASLCPTSATFMCKRLAPDGGKC